MHLAVIGKLLGVIYSVHIQSLTKKPLPIVSMGRGFLLWFSTEILPQIFPKTIATDYKTTQLTKT